ncbi:MAG TPA: GIY-YIG nuclease family protein [Alphaproteobacteria bacterium]|nr:GIY-YIG nuclease family protein [Alphaproteobacteria bacterium]
METLRTGRLAYGSLADCRAVLRSALPHYVYILRRPDGRPFYVGKGTGDRLAHHENEARHPNDWRSNAYKLNVIRAIQRSGAAIVYEIDFVTDDEAAAYAREGALIEAIGRLHEGGPLTNLAAGGGTTGGPSPASKARHAATLSGTPDDNPARAALNAYVKAIGPMASVPIKPLDQFTARPTQRFPKVTRQPTLRPAVLLVAAAAASGIMLDGPCRIPRRVAVNGVEGLIENGVSSDILTAGMADIVPAADPRDELFSLTAGQARQVVGLVGRAKCIDLGVLPATT